MTVIVSLVFLMALALTCYAFYATLVPALPRINELMAEPQMTGKPRMIYFGIDRRTAYRMEQEQKLVMLRARNAAQASIYKRAAPFRHAA